MNSVYPFTWDDLGLVSDVLISCEDSTAMDVTLVDGMLLGVIDRR